MKIALKKLITKKKTNENGQTACLSRFNTLTLKEQSSTG